MQTSSLSSASIPPFLQVLGLGATRLPVSCALLDSLCVYRSILEYYLFAYTSESILYTLFYTLFISPINLSWRLFHISAYKTALLLLSFLILTQEYVYWFSEVGGDRERGIDGREKHRLRDSHPVGALTKGGLNPQTFGVWDDAPINWATQPGQNCLIF